MAHIDIGQNSLLNLYSGVEVTDGLQVAFSSPKQQYDYFMKRVVKQYSAMSYIYRNGVVKIQDTPQVVAKANYISFNNPSFESKPIYARIVDYQYVNNATVRITYSVDWFQTFMFDVNYRSCQILREHLSEADWTKAVANPWDTSIMEMNTSEDFTFSEEQRAKIDISNSTHYMIAPDDSKDCYVCLALASFSYEVEDGAGGSGSTPGNDIHAWTSTFNKGAEWAIAHDDFRNVYVGPNSDAAANDGIADPVHLYIWKLGDTYASAWQPSGNWGTGTDKLSGILNDLTALSKTSQIISLYYLPKSVLRAFLGYADTPKNMVKIGNLTARCSGGANPKLKRFPFSYLTVESPAGNRKEYHYEEFEKPESGINFNLMGMMNGTPYLSLVPYNYRYFKPSSGSDLAITTEYRNITERLDYTEIPQLPYTTDGFLTYMSGLYQQAMQNQSVPNQLARMGEFAGGALALTKGLAGTLAGGLMPNSMPIDSSGVQKAISSAMGDAAMGGNNKMAAMGGASAMAHAIGSQIHDANVIENMGGKTFLGSPAYDYRTEKALYDNDIYHPGTAGGFPAYRLQRFYFQFFFVTLNDAWTKLVDTYFNAFGYRSGRIGIPRIVNFIKGTGEQPHFTTYDGAPTTYVQTTDAKVISTMQPVSQNIQAMLNAGCRFINGNGR